MRTHLYLSVFLAIVVAPMPASAQNSTRVNGVSRDVPTVGAVDADPHNDAEQKSEQPEVTALPDDSAKPKKNSDLRWGFDPAENPPATQFWPARVAPLDPSPSTGGGSAQASADDAKSLFHAGKSDQGFAAFPAQEPQTAKPPLLSDGSAHARRTDPFGTRPSGPGQLGTAQAKPGTNRANTFPSDSSETTMPGKALEEEDLFAPFGEGPFKQSSPLAKESPLPRAFPKIGVTDSAHSETSRTASRKPARAGEVPAQANPAATGDRGVNGTTNANGDASKFASSKSKRND